MNSPCVYGLEFRIGYRQAMREVITAAEARNA